MSLRLTKKSDRHLSREKRALEMLASLSYRTGEITSYLQTVALSVSELIDLDWSVVTLCRDGYERVLASTIDLGEDADELYELHGSLTGFVFNSGMPLVVDNALTCKDYGEAPEGYSSYLGIPLRSPNGEVIGTICSFQSEPRHFTEEEVRLVSIFAERAGTAIDNYQLYQQQQEFNRRLEIEVAKRTAELHEAQAELMAINNQLELRVQQRTEALQKSEEQLRQIAENLEQVFWMYSHDGEPIYVSPAFEAVWGMPCDRWYTDPAAWRDTVHPEDRERVWAAFDGVCKDKFDIEYRIFRPDGTLRIIRDRAFPVRDGSGAIYRLAGIAEDITDRKLEQQKTLQAIERLAELGELAATIVHEVRNPLTTVLMGLNFFQRMELSSPAQKRLDLALDEASRLTRLLNEILLYAKHQTLQMIPIELNTWIAGLMESVKTMPAVTGRQIHFLPAAEPTYVCADPDKLKQVCINLLSNACEAIAVGDVIAWSVTSDPSTRQACMCWHNGGTPISPEILAKLTKPFFTTKPNGNGLGLAIVKQIVRAHGGELIIESSEAIAGTTATIKLPLATPLPFSGSERLNEEQV